jgi:MarR family transcriptional regulator, 2-MHQ and catechol-resistance regulon repressor
MSRPEGRGDSDGRRLLTGVRALVRRFALSERADVQCCGMTVAQAATLEALEEEGPMRLGALGRRLGITPSTLTRNVDRLEAGGLVARVDEAQDARAARVELTDAGRRVAQRLWMQEEGFAEAILQALPPSRRRAALDGLTDILGAVRQATEACCPGAFDHLMKDFPRALACGEANPSGKTRC